VDCKNDLKASCFTEAGPYRRPFSPNVNWNTAKVFIVGNNPATPFRDEFESYDQYWSGLTEDPPVFYREYFRKHRGGASKTTVWILQFLAMLHPINCLVTNVSWYPASRRSEVPTEEWKTGKQGLLRLRECCHPVVLFCHGERAEELAHEWGADVDRHAPAANQNCIVNGTLWLAYDHLSGLGVRQGEIFVPASELPTFASKIRRHVYGA
jgi:hypothetical protein